jgi:hypothetical protein
MVFGDFRGVKLKGCNVIWEHPNFVKKKGMVCILIPTLLPKGARSPHYKIKLVYTFRMLSRRLH